MKDFYEKRKKGENESNICELIRNDSIEDFIVHINEMNIPLGMTIKPSIFETHPLLIKNKTTLIEYAAYFGSIQIVQYMINNNIELKPSLWIYAIHSNNAELINLLEQNNIKPEDESFEECFKESIKCHHNEVANYINDNFLNQQNENENINFDKNAVCYAFHYHNFDFFPNNLKNNEFIFFYACKYDHILIIEYLLTTQKIDVNKSIVLNITFFKKNK